ncbi:MAG: HD domain-containing protein [Sedimentisphaerales bacterium]|nr:HD domain-containing protein [Sedimentisphaerales bacterium]
MNREQTDKIKTWFDGYVGGFYGDDEYVNANIKLKDVHSRRVCSEMQYLAGALALSENQKAIARAIGLLHDVGRFEQFRKYRTYKDHESVNHCTLGVEVLMQSDILGDLDPAEREIIEKAVEYHGLKELPADLTDSTLLFARMIRDADKIDVFRVIAEYQKLYEQDRDNFMLEIELADEPNCTPEIIGAILNGQLIDYSRLRTLNDMRLMQLGWVYDVNFQPSLERIRQRKFLDMLLGCLPQTEEMRRVEEKVLTYVDAKLRGEG